MSRLPLSWFLCLGMLSAAIAAKLQRTEQEEDNKEKPAYCTDKQWLNELDGHLFYECTGRHSITSIYAVYDNTHRDRQFRVACGYNKATKSCSWESNYANDWDKPLSFICPHHGFISGISSIHRNKYDDRRYKFKCCNDERRYFTVHCITSSFVNDWKKALEIKINRNKGYYLVGIFSEHENKHQDRRWKYRYCKLRYRHKTQR